MRLRKHFAWLIVLLAIFINHYFLKDQYFRQSLQIVQDIQYGDFLIQKWFLVLVAFFIFGWWSLSQKITTKLIKDNLLPVVLIALITFAVHWLSFYRWFEFDDYRVIGTHYAVVGTANDWQMGLSNSPFYGIGMVYLVVRWFGTSYELYNTLGLIFYSLVGVVVFFIAKQLQLNKLFSLLAAIFFVTSPTYYRQILMMQELIGDGFSVLLFVLAIYFLLRGFYPGAVAFAAANLEFGLSRAHFIAVPLVLIGLFLITKHRLKRERLVAIVVFPVLTLLYFALFQNYFPQDLEGGSLVANLRHFLRIGDSVFAVSVPHGIAYPLISLLRYLSDFNYISVGLGFLIIVSLGLTILWLFKTGRSFIGGIFLVASAILVGGIVLPTFSGVRVVHELEPLTAQYDSEFPTSATSYGVFSTVGLTLLFIGISKVIKRGVFFKIATLLLIINSVTILMSDREWIKQYSKPTRASNPQLEEIIPADGAVKVIYTPPPSEILSRYVSFFYQLYRIKEPLYFTNDASAFIQLIEDHQPETKGVFLLTQDSKTYKIYDHSEKLRTHYPNEQISPELLNSLTEND